MRFNLKMILPRLFYEQDVIEVSKDLLGKVLVHETAEGTTSGRIVETEAYCGPEDQAAHSFRGRKTIRNEVMYGPKGHAYVYLIYGIYFCINVTAGNIAGKPEAVLIRALEPLKGVEIMAQRRKIPGAKVANLANGPGKLCIAMDITKKLHKTDITTPPLYIEDALPIARKNIVDTTRVGVNYAGDWKNRFWRFYIKDNDSVSMKKALKRV